MERLNINSPEFAPLLQLGESVHHKAEALEADMAVTDRRILIRNGERVALDLPFEGIRRIQLDVERRRPSSLVIVPDEARYEPQVLSVDAQALHEVAAAVATIGQRLANGAAEG